MDQAKHAAPTSSYQIQGSLAAPLWKIKKKEESLSALSSLRKSPKSRRNTSGFLHLSLATKIGANFQMRAGVLLPTLGSSPHPFLVQLVGELVRFDRLCLGRRRRSIKNG